MKRKFEAGPSSRDAEATQQLVDPSLSKSDYGSCLIIGRCEMFKNCIEFELGAVKPNLRSV